MSAAILPTSSLDAWSNSFRFPRFCIMLTRLQAELSHICKKTGTVTPIFHTEAASQLVYTCVVACTEIRSALLVVAEFTVQR